jgi:hypothetical protein
MFTTFNCDFSNLGFTKIKDCQHPYTMNVPLCSIILSGSCNIWGMIMGMLKYLACFMYPLLTLSPLKLYFHDSSLNYVYLVDLIKFWTFIVGWTYCL